jgi:ribosomal protein L3 glutamine methyltransferase
MGQAMTDISALLTVRDFLRYTVSSFGAAKLAHGHGATNALDEAAFIILESLKLPVQDINPWLDAKLLEPERQNIAKLIEARITTRKPAAYLLNKTYMQGVPFYVDERVIIPRSYIGELLASGLFENQALDLDPANIHSILDLCTGSGCLAILAANYFDEAEIHGSDLSKDALEVAAINVKDHNLESRITLHNGSLFAPFGNQKFDLIISNPPYVAKAEVDAFPPEYAHEPVMAHLGGADGFDLVREIIRETPKHINKGGGLLCEIGTGADILAAEFPKLNFFWLDSEDAESEVFFLKF